VHGLQLRYIYIYIGDGGCFLRVPETIATEDRQRKHCAFAAYPAMAL
jgi:hypothetical protein